MKKATAKKKIVKPKQKAKVKNVAKKKAKLDKEIQALFDELDELDKVIKLEEKAEAKAKLERQAKFAKPRLVKKAKRNKKKEIGKKENQLPYTTKNLKDKIQDMIYEISEDELDELVKFVSKNLNIPVGGGDELDVADDIFYAIEFSERFEVFELELKDKSEYATRFIKDWVEDKNERNIYEFIEDLRMYGLTYLP